MKIRTDFVTNSSSTSFVIITAEEFTLERFLILMGLEKTSPFVQVFEGLYYSLRERISHTEDDQAYRDGIESSLLPHVQERIKRARDQGQNVLLGNLSSDTDTIESFFCVDSFEVEQDGLFFSALENSW